MSNNISCPKCGQKSISFFEELNIDGFGTDTYTPKRIEHFSEIGLMRQMEKYEMGAPATRDTGEIFKSLYRSGLIKMETKTAKILPTDKGIALVDRLANSLYCDLNFSIKMEKLLEDNKEAALLRMQDDLLTDFFKHIIVNPKEYEQKKSSPETLILLQKNKSM